tara:strand:- start:534 stop:1034 length:501 start_codon:yes stop_codon:yes gene_type:complete
MPQEGAKRLRDGSYNYKGYNIKQFGKTQWNFGLIGADGFDDAANSLKEAKLFIDETVKDRNQGNLFKKGGARIPRKKGQPARSKKHSDLYTDENPKGTIRGLKFTTAADAKASVAKIKRSNRSHAHKTQAAIAMEQRARVAGKAGAARIYRAFIEQQKRITKRKKK